MPCIVVVGYHHFAGPCCFHLQGHFTLMNEIARTPEMLISYHNTTQHYNPEDLNLNLHCCGNSNLTNTFLVVEDITRLMSGGNRKLRLTGSVSGLRLSHGR
jgi:hypothetical protein